MFLELKDMIFPIERAQLSIQHNLSKRTTLRHITEKFQGIRDKKKVVYAFRKKGDREETGNP